MRAALSSPCMNMIGPSDAKTEQFIRDGLVKIDAAFPRQLADEARAILWRDTAATSTIRRRGSSR